MMKPQTGDGARSGRALGPLNFSLADVRDGLGPFLGIYLVGRGWSPEEIGFVLTIGGIAGLLATTPAGALVDATRRKRGLIVCCAGLIIAVNFALLVWPQSWVVGVSQIATGIAAAAIGPAILGLTLGLVGQDGLSHQLGRNEAWNHAGNAVAAILAGASGYVFGISAVFYLMAGMALLTIFFVSRIDPDEIDHDEARGASRETHATADLASVFARNPMLVVVGATLLLFHFGNAAMLPLLGQRVAVNATMNPAAYTAGTVVIAQMTMIPLALLAAAWARRNGYWLLFVAALAVLPLRGLVAGLVPGLWTVLPVQMLDGIGAGLLGVATPGLVAQILKGTGRVNLGLGAVMTAQGIGASLSPAFAGLIAQWFSYDAAFLALAGVGVAALAVWLVAFDRSVRSSAAPATG